MRSFFFGVKLSRRHWWGGCRSVKAGTRLAHALLLWTSPLLVFRLELGTINWCFLLFCSDSASLIHSSIHSFIHPTVVSRDGERSGGRPHQCLSSRVGSKLTSFMLTCANPIWCIEGTTISQGFVLLLLLMLQKRWQVFVLIIIILFFKKRHCLLRQLRQCSLELVASCR